MLPACTAAAWRHASTKLLCVARLAAHGTRAQALTSAMRSTNWPAPPKNRDSSEPPSSMLARIRAISNTEICGREVGAQGRSGEGSGGMGAGYVALHSS